MYIVVGITIGATRESSRWTLATPKFQTPILDFTHEIIITFILLLFYGNNNVQIFYLI